MGNNGKSGKGIGKRYAVCLCLALAVYTGLSGCQDKIKPGTAEVRRTVVRGATAVKIAPTLVQEFREEPGTVKAKTISVVASRLMGTVTAVAVREGDRVRKGQVLLTIDDRDVAEKIKAAEKGREAADENRKLADITYQRYGKMYEEKAISRQERDQIETQKKVADIEYERAKALLAEARVYLGFTKITSPVAGIVSGKRIEQGSMAAPGMPLLTVEDTASYYVEVTVDESLSGKIKPGTPVQIAIDASGMQLHGAVTEIVPTIDPLSRTFLMKAGISAPGLRNGLSARVKIPLGTKELMLVPATAVVEKGQLTGIYTVDAKNVISYRLVRLGRKYEKGVELLSGLSPNERVITGGVNLAIDGGILEAGK